MAAHGLHASPEREARSARRYPASAVPSITGLRISPHGVEATLVNISMTGVLAECGERLKPGSLLTVNFEGTFEPRTAEGRVARVSVASMGPNGRLRYHVGISFSNPIPLDAILAQPSPPAAAPKPAPVEETTSPSARVVRNRW
jgi:hypothetical protein